MVSATVLPHCRHGRARPGLPRPCSHSTLRTWMPGVQTSIVVCARQTTTPGH